MTRVNVIPVKELTDKHLLAEHREIKRIPNVIISGRFSMTGQPEEYKLGTGHVKFFYSRLHWLFRRYIKIYDECIRRGFNVQDYTLSFVTAIKMHPELAGGYTPTTESTRINRERIKERLQT